MNFFELLHGDRYGYDDNFKNGKYDKTYICFLTTVNGVILVSG